MLRCLILCALLGTAASHAAVFPEQIGELTCTASPMPAPSDTSLYTEFGFQVAEQASCSSPAVKFNVQAWRTRDSTGALALFESRRPATATTSDLGKLAVKTGPSGVLLAAGNYVLQFAGHVPSPEELGTILEALPEQDNSALPALFDYLPAEDLVPNSQRYILGPTGLERSEPRISPSLAAFSLDSEGFLGRYKSPKGEMTLVVFSYPTPSIARERQAEFLKQPGVLAKREGPLVAVIVQPPDPDAAERVLGRINYKASVSWSEVPAKKGNDMGNLIVTGMALAGVLFGASLLAGLWLGGFKVLLRKLGLRSEPEGLTVLRINDK